MNTHSIRHAWFPPAIPKRKHDLEVDRELDAESEWPSAYRALAGPGMEPRPAKRLRALEGGLAGLTLKNRSELGGGMNAEPIKINTNPAFLSTNNSSQLPPASSSSPPIGNQIHDAPLDGEAEPYISSIYEWASPHTGVESVASLPLRGEVSEVNTSDESDGGGMRDEMEEERNMIGKRMGEGVFVQVDKGIPGYTVYEPESGPEKRKRVGEDEEHGPEKKGKRTWYEPEKDRIVVLDLDSSEDESMTRSPRRRRSAFSLSSTSQGTSFTRPRSQTETQKDTPEYVINPTLLSHISPPGAGEGKGLLSIPREEDAAKAVVLYKPVLWRTGMPPVGADGDGEVIDIEEAASGPASMEASPLIRDDDDAMDIDL